MTDAPLPFVSEPEPNDPNFYIGVCGYPKVGKTEFAKILEGYRPDIIRMIDDGRPLRDGVIGIYGLTERHVSTQEGKSTEIEVCGKKHTVRALLGDLGNLLECHYGTQILPELSIRRAKLLNPPNGIGGHIFVFPSVRKDQGLTYHRNGGFLVEITRPGCTSNYDFDQYDQSRAYITHRIENNGTIDEFKRLIFQIADEALKLWKERVIRAKYGSPDAVKYIPPSNSDTSLEAGPGE